MRKPPIPASETTLAPVIAVPATAFRFKSDFRPGLFILTCEGKSHDVEVREHIEGAGKASYEIRSVHFLAEPDRKPYSMTDLRRVLDAGASFERIAG